MAIPFTGVPSPSTGVTLGPNALPDPSTASPEFIRVFGLQNATPEQIQQVMMHPGAQSAFQGVDFRDDLGTPEQRFKAFQERIRKGQKAGDPKFMVTDVETGAFHGDQFLDAARAFRDSAGPVNRFTALGTAGILAGGLPAAFGGGSSAPTSTGGTTFPLTGGEAGSSLIGGAPGLNANLVEVGAAAAPTPTFMTPSLTSAATGGAITGGSGKTFLQKAQDAFEDVKEIFGDEQSAGGGGTINISSLPQIFAPPAVSNDDIFTRLLAIALASRQPERGRTPPIRGNR